jgi:hypothetical protein
LSKILAKEEELVCDEKIHHFALRKEYGISKMPK